MRDLREQDVQVDGDSRSTTPSVGVERKPYKRPELRHLGSVKDLTLTTSTKPRGGGDILTRGFQPGA